MKGRHRGVRCDAAPASAARACGLSPAQVGTQESLPIRAAERGALRRQTGGTHPADEGEIAPLLHRFSFFTSNGGCHLFRRVRARLLRRGLRAPRSRGRLQLTQAGQLRSTPVVAAKAVRARAPARAVAVCSADATSSRRQARRCRPTAFFGNGCYRRLAHAHGSPSLPLPSARVAGLVGATGGARPAAPEPSQPHTLRRIITVGLGRFHGWRYQRIAPPAARIRCATRRGAVFAARELCTRTVGARSMQGR